MTLTLSPTQLLTGVTVALGILVSGCTSVLPSSNNVSKSPWVSYTDAKEAFDRIDTKTTKEALVVLGFDPAALPNARILNYVDVVSSFGSAFRLEDLPEGVKACVKARETCQGYAITSRNIKNQRNGNVALDLFGFGKRTQTTGWEFSATLVLVDNVVAYKLWNGTPNVNTTNSERNPLGPMQSLGGMIPKPF